MKRLIIILTLTITQLLPAQNTTPDMAVSSLVGDPTFSHASAGVKIVRKGETLAAHDAHKLYIPASNMKLISTGAALYHLGTDHRFCTTISHDGYIEDGVLYGNLYIVGGADPTLGSKDSIAVALDKVFAQWTKAIKDAGITAIDGHVIGDGRYMEGMMEEPTWLWNDIGTYYGCGVSGLNFYENMISFNADVDFSSKEPTVRLAQHYPATPWMEITYDCGIGEKSTGDRLYMYTSDLAPVASIRGTYGIDRGAKRVDFSNKFPEYTCASYFSEYLEKKGISCSKGPADFKLKTGWAAADSLRTITSTWSPTLERIAFETNHISNNLYAETLFRTLGKDIEGSSCYESSRKAIRKLFIEMGLGGSIDGIRMQDGSGLSRQNYVSADFICAFLEAMMDSPCFDEFICGLPVPGGDGSLNYNMKGYPLSLRSRIRVKSGSMNGVRCYSGYILPSGFTLVRGQEIPQHVKDQIIIFSVMTNNCTSPTWKVRPRLDKFMAEITAF